MMNNFNHYQVNSRKIPHFRTSGSELKRNFPQETHLSISTSSRFRERERVKKTKKETRAPTRWEFVPKSKKNSPISNERRDQRRENPTEMQYLHPNRSEICITNYPISTLILFLLQSYWEDDREIHTRTGKRWIELCFEIARADPGDENSEYIGKKESISSWCSQKNEMLFWQNPTPSINSVFLSLHPYEREREGEW